jgi:hypothetical protein
MPLLFEMSKVSITLFQAKKGVNAQNFIAPESLINLFGMSFLFRLSFKKMA